MLTEFLYSFPLLLLLVYGVFHISDVGFSVGMTEQASFFSARSAFVGNDQTEQATKYISRAAINPFVKDEDLPSVPHTFVHHEEKFPRVTVAIPYPDLDPQISKLFGSRGRRILRSTPIPRKKEEE